jgi:cell fate (sporulation/competence/biofilm development) regulator YlbF (YheA/YmcA/DUF963 family)
MDELKNKILKKINKLEEKITQLEKLKKKYDELNKKVNLNKKNNIELKQFINKKKKKRKGKKSGYNIFMKEQMEILKTNNIKGKEAMKKIGPKWKKLNKKKK